MTASDQVPISLSDLPLLLRFIPANDRETWITVGMGVKAEFGANGWDAWDVWSQSGTGYNLRDAKSVWKSFRKSGTGLGSVVKMAMDNGWTPEKKELTAEEKRRFAREHEARRRAREAETLADEAKAAKMAGEVAAACSVILAQHCAPAEGGGYLAKKGVEAFGVSQMRHAVVLEIDDQAERCQLWVGEDAQQYLAGVPNPRPAHLSMLVLRRGDLIVPLRAADGQVQTLQQVSSTGKKLFPRYGRKSGCSHALGELTGAEVIGLAEGYATAASCQMAVGWPMVMAVDSGNLPKVAELLRATYPAARIVVCGDDDPAKPGNPGRTKAEAAARAVGGVAVFPAGADGKDWNDLHAAQGLDSVREQLQAALQMLPAVYAADDLPPAPSGDATEAAAPASEGAGERVVDPGTRVFQRFALVEGKTSVYDQYKRCIIKKTAFEALVTKAVAKAWYEREDKKCIAEDQAKLLEEKARLAGKVKKGDQGGMLPTDRYVYIDGTKECWDVQKRRRIHDGALKMALGDAYGLWVNSPDRRVVDVEHLVFDPRMEKDPSVYINTFEGLPMTPTEDFSKCRAILEVIDFLCNGDEASRHWLLCWLALPLQRVGSKMATAVLAHSTMEGSGKSLLFSDVMREIYGANGATVGQVQLESSWSAWQSNMLWGVFEEVVSRDQRYNQTGKIKHMITGKTHRIESKFMTGWEESNYMNAAFLSNEILPWPISANDRRLLVLWPEGTLQGDLQTRVINEINSDGIPAFYGYLLQYDVGDFHAHTRPPRTPARQRLVELSMASWQTFMAQWRAGHLGRLWRPCASSDLYALFLEWCSRNKEHTLSHTKFSGFISTEVPKAQGVPWRDPKGKRLFGSFFFPPPPPTATGEPSSPAPSLKADELGKAIAVWRQAAKDAGWSVYSWEHLKDADK
ncbi:DUF5906 domain-containing protein [Pseudomonas sp. LRF_L74]|uniref:DUF5906 domain-containing protein n=1 Tax=Pseudomonas sp. LRF_L74 TaxID=3369422 RepID=UPI003F5FC3C5